MEKKTHVRMLAAVALALVLALAAPSASALGAASALVPPLYQQPANAPSFTSVEQMQDYFLQCVNQRKQTITFYMDPDLEQISAGEFCRLASLFFCSSSYNASTGRYDIQITYYPGTRIADAYAAGDLSTLTKDERQVLEKAQQVVRQAQEESQTGLMLELKLHDWICANVSYTTSNTDFTQIEDAPRTLTAVGALLDGQANCQGYTDAFYLLGTLAGFNVDRMSGFSGDDRHMWNTIELDGRWFVVDVTADDAPISGDPANQVYVNYRYFNAGRDVISDTLTWPELYEYRPIEQASNHNYYYFTPQSNSFDCFGAAFWDLDNMADFIYRRMRNDHQALTYTLAVNQTFDWDALSDEIMERTTHDSRRTSWYIWVINAAGNTYCITFFTEF
jgi:hypothetical protein